MVGAGAGFGLWAFEDLVIGVGSILEQYQNTLQMIFYYLFEESR